MCRHRAFLSALGGLLLFSICAAPTLAREAGRPPATAGRHHGAGAAAALASAAPPLLRLPAAPSGSGNSNLLLQGYSPSGFAITNDGLHAYVAISTGVVAKVRLSDVVVVATVDLSSFFPAELINIAGRRGEEAVRAHAHAAEAPGDRHRHAERHPHAG